MCDSIYLTGAKFGGYGSFLPTYQRSPAISSQPRTPLKVQSYIPPKSPNNPPSEVSVSISKLGT